MTIRNVSWLRTQLARLLNFDPDDPDAAWQGPEGDPWALIDDFAQEAYEQIVADAVNDIGRPELFASTMDITWASADVTYQIPSYLDPTSFVEVRDVTNDSMGEIKIIRPLGASNGSELWWKSHDTLQWGISGPGKATTLRLFYIVPEELSGELSEPTLLPHRFRQLWKWEAALLARRYRDEDAVPAHWYKQKEDWKTRLHHALMQGSPMGPVGAVIDPFNNNRAY